MMFMITMPPTRSEIADTPMMTMKIAPDRFRHSDMYISGVTTSKLSGVPGRRCRRVRRIARASSCACSNELCPRLRSTMLTDSVRPNHLRKVPNGTSA